MVEVNTKAPGKLYIAGEYAVVEPGYSAIITAVDLFIHLKIREATEAYGSIYSEGFTPEAVKWQRVEESIQVKQPTKALRYVLAAMQTTEDYLSELDVPLRNYHMKFKSEMTSEAGRKLGVGSSGAVTVAVVQGLLEFYAIEFTDELIYKLSVLAQFKLGVNSSFGDLAAITYTGWVHYTSFDREAVFEYFQRYSVRKTVEIAWPHLKIERLPVPKDLNFLIGWTGRPASSNQLVGAVQEKKVQSTEQYNHFLSESKIAVEQLNGALLENNTPDISAAIHRNRDALLQMGQQTNVLIETPKLTTLCTIAQRYGGAGKTSGAGGGDSGIAFIFEEELVDLVLNEWQAAGIKQLPLSIYTKAANI